MSTPSDKTLRLERTKLTPQAPKGGRNTTLILAVIAGFAAAALALIWLRANSQQKPTVVTVTAAPPPPTPVVIANQDISAREVITSSMIHTITVDQSKMEPNAVASPMEVVGQVAVLPIKNGQQVTKDEIGPAIYPVEGLAGIIPPGKRAMTIALNPTSSVAGFVKPGDHVDVMATFDLGRGHTVERVVLQDVLLLATGAQVIQTTPVPPPTNNNNGALGTSSSDNSNGQNPDNDVATTPKPTEVPNATVEVTPVDAEKLILAGSKGVLMLALRSAKDTFPTIIPTVEATTVTGHRYDDVGQGAPRVVAPQMPPMPMPTPVQPVQAAPPPYTITVIKGPDSRQVTVSP